MLQVDVEKTCFFFLFLQELQKIHLDKWMVLQCAFSQRCCIPKKWFDNYALVFFGPQNRFKAKIPMYSFLVTVVQSLYEFYWVFSRNSVFNKWWNLRSIYLENSPHVKIYGLVVVVKEISIHP